MEAVLFLAPFVVLGSAIVLIAFSGGPAKAREAYLTRGNRTFRAAMLAVYVLMGVVVPLAIIGAREDAVGTGALATEAPSPEVARGKTLFRQTCAGCHTLAAVNARGVTGPSLDDIGEITPDRILAAIATGGTGQDRMPSNLLEGENAQAVADYVSAVAGRAGQ